MNGTFVTLEILWTILFFGLPPLLRWLFNFSLDISWLTYGLGCVAIYIGSGINVVKQWNRRPVMRLGKYTETLGPGVKWVDPILCSMLPDLSIQDYVVTLKVENIQTHDNVPLAFSLILTMNIIESRVVDFVTKAQQAWQSTEKRAIAVTSECVSNSELDDVLHGREKLSLDITQKLQERVAAWGMNITAVELQNIKITDESIEQAIAMKARARKEGEAELARAEIQTKVAKQLKIAADEYDEESWKLKGFETLIELCRSADNNTILIPTDLLDAIATLSGKRKSLP